jgi:hypothetical protein
MPVGFAAIVAGFGVACAAVEISFAEIRFI